MKYILPFVVFFFSFPSVFADAERLPESADPSTYTVVSSCYAHDSVTFYSRSGSILGDYADWKDITIFEDGCFAKLRNTFLYNGHNFTYYDNTKKKNVFVLPDPKTFHIVSFPGGEKLGIDKNHIFRENSVFSIPPGFDISRLRIVEGNYITDEKTIYFFRSGDGRLVRIENIDIPTFHAVEYYTWQTLYTDKKWVYFFSTYFDVNHHASDPESIGYLDVKKMQSFPQYDLPTLTQTGAFVYDKYHIYQPSGFTGVDMPSFHVLSDGFSADRNHVYSPDGNIFSEVDVRDTQYIGNGIIRSHNALYRWRWYNSALQKNLKLREFDPSTFAKTSYGFSDKRGHYNAYLDRIVTPIFSGNLVQYGDTSYYHDNKNVYLLDWNGVSFLTLTGAIVKDFRLFETSGYMTDLRSCWYAGTPFPCDAKSLTVIDSFFAKDAKSVYYQEKKIAGADPKTFRAFIDNASMEDRWTKTIAYYRDKNHVYYNDYVLKDADPESLILLKDSQAKDKTHIYYGDHKISEADYASYTPLRYSFSRDKNHLYYAGVVIDGVENPEEVKVIDWQRVLYRWKIQGFWCLNKKSDNRFCK